jgi:DNA-binding Lrp family transcriptional regulator
MDQQAIARLSTKNDWQTLQMELLNYRLSPIEAKAIVHRVRHYLDEHEPDRLDEGQIFYSAVAFSEPASKPLKECRLVRIKLTLYAPEDLDYLAVGRGGAPKLRRARLFRLVFEAVEQGTILSQEDLVRLLGISRRTVVRIVEEYRERGVFVPTRGYCKDMGRGTTHKTVAVKMYLEYATYTEIERETGDTPSSSMRYIKGFAAVVNAVDAGLSPDRVRVVTGMSKKLVSEYIDLYRRYDTEEHRDILDRIRHPLKTTVAPGEAKKRGRR